MSTQFPLFLLLQRNLITGSWRPFKQRYCYGSAKPALSQGNGTQHIEYSPCISLPLCVVGLWDNMCCVGLWDNMCCVGFRQCFSFHSLPIFHSLHYFASLHTRALYHTSMQTIATGKTICICMPKPIQITRSYPTDVTTQTSPDSNPNVAAFYSPPQRLYKNHHTIGPQLKLAYLRH